ncbi:teichoic acid transport system ATP-binding protein [Lachnospiraceae bacterium XBB1006]|nr:teichoic acid transport system ATP-binding protein [Lachnospiraceae bacterium XBB1006]
MENAIVFRNVTKRYKLYKDDRQRLHAVFNKRIKPTIKEAINDMSFEIKKGDSVALFGRNGAGKSTLLKMITGVIYPTKGEIEVNGRVSALLELTAGFDPDFTGRENIYFRGQLMGISNEEIKELEESIVEFADIGDYMDQPVRTYSSGMKARLGFAINANVEPEILIVDEALSVGDKAFRLKCNQKIREILASGDVTFLFVTHTTEVAKDFCKRGMVLKEGKLIYDDQVEKAADFYEEMVDREMEEAKKKKKKKKKTIMQM